MSHLVQNISCHGIAGLVIISELLPELLWGGLIRREKVYSPLPLVNTFFLFFKSNKVISVRLFGYVILIDIDFYDFIFRFFLGFSFD